MVIHALATSPVTQRHGVGSEMIRFCVDRAKAEGSLIAPSVVGNRNPDQIYCRNVRKMALRRLCHSEPVSKPRARSLGFFLMGTRENSCENERHYDIMNMLIFRASFEKRVFVFGSEMAAPVVAKAFAEKTKLSFVWSATDQRAGQTHSKGRHRDPRRLRRGAKTSGLDPFNPASAHIARVKALI